MANIQIPDYKLKVYRDREKAIKEDKQKIANAKISNDKSQIESIHKYIDGKYGAYILDWGKGMYGYSIEYGFNYELLDTESMISNLDYMCAKMEGYALGFTKPSISEHFPNNNVSVNVTNTNEVNITLTFEQARSKVEDMTSLTDEETKEILERISDLEEIINSKDKKKAKWEKAKSILIWLADKSFDVGMTLLPLLLKLGEQGNV